MYRPTIELAKKIQEDLDLKDIHIVWFGETGFTIAHTDRERASINLEDCLLHKALVALDEIPEGLDIGWHMVVPGGECLYNITPIDRLDYEVSINFNIPISAI